MSKASRYSGSQSNSVITALGVKDKFEQLIVTFADSGRTHKRAFQGLTSQVPALPALASVRLYAPPQQQHASARILLFIFNLLMFSQVLSSVMTLSLSVTMLPTTLPNGKNHPCSLTCYSMPVPSINDFAPTVDKPFVLGLPTGSSPIPTYKALIEKVKEGSLS